MNKPLKTATINGIQYEARPVPFGYIRKMIEAEHVGDDEGKLLVMADTVAECVTQDGNPVDVDALDVETIGELYLFIVTPSKKTGADFTTPGSPDGMAGSATETPPMT